jgi:tripartite ATP-independent transporter DctP family solute receptor
MSKNMFMVISVLIIMTVVFAGCGNNNNNKAANTSKDNSSQSTDVKVKEEAKPTKKFTLKFSSPAVPTDAHTEAMYLFKEEIEKETEGQIKVEVHHSGSLYTSDNELQAMLRGNLEMMFGTPFNISETVPKVSMFTSGYFFKDYDHMTKTLNGEIGREIFDEIAAVTGGRPLGAWYFGTRTLNYRDIGKEIRTPEDLAGVKLRMPNTPTWMFLGKALGGNPAPMALSEVYLGLSTGTIDAQDNPLTTTYNNKFHEVAKNVALTGHIVDSVWPTINEKVWQELGPELQEKVYTAVANAGKYVDETNLNIVDELVEKMKAEGVTVTVPDVNAFRETVQKAYLEDKDLMATWDMDLYERVMALTE